MIPYQHEIYSLLRNFPVRLSLFLAPKIFHLCYADSIQRKGQRMGIWKYNCCLPTKPIWS